MIYLFLTLSTYIIFSFLQKKLKSPLLNPVLFSIIVIILIMKFFNIEYEEYKTGGNFISLLLGPATVALALPLYRNWKILKTRGIVLLAGIIVGTITAILSVYFLSRLFGLNKEIILSLLPKSITTPIGMEVSRKIGGIVSLTVSVIVLTGITGNMLGPLILKLLRIKDPVAVGAAFGTASHAIGTSKALEIGEVEGAISGVCISIAGLLTAILIPLLLLFI